MIKVLRGCTLSYTFSQFSAHPLQDGQYAICHTFIVASSSLLPCGLQSTHPRMPCYISPYVVYNVYDNCSFIVWNMSPFMLTSFVVGSEKIGYSNKCLNKIRTIFHLNFWRKCVFNNIC